MEQGTNNNDDNGTNDEEPYQGAAAAKGWIPAALEHYLATNQPDPIVERQMRAWSLAWSPSFISSNTTTAGVFTSQSAAVAATTETTDQQQQNGNGNNGGGCDGMHTTCLTGQLTWSSDYLRVIIQSECQWRVKEEEEVMIDDNNNHPTTTVSNHPCQGPPSPSSSASFDFVCRVVQIDHHVHSPQSAIDNDDDDDAAATTTTTSLVVQERMRQRFAQDPEIQRLRQGTRANAAAATNKNENDNNNDNSMNSPTRTKQRSSRKKKQHDMDTDTTNHHHDHDDDTEDTDDCLLCQAQIQCSPNAIAPSSSSSSPHKHPLPMAFLEERVWTNPRALEGVRRAVWGTSDSWMDVLDWLTHFLLLVVPFSSSLPGEMLATAAAAAAGTATMITTEHTADPPPTTTTTTNTRRIESMQRALSHRAHLRLLEDALCDACEQQAAEEEMIQELLDLQSLSPSLKRARV